MRKKGEGDVLVFRFSALGDVAMTLPPLYDACQRNPHRRFIFITRPHPAEMFVNTPGNLEVFTPDLSQYKGVAGLVRLQRDLRRRYPEADTVVDLHDVLRTKVVRKLCRLSGMRVAHLDKMRRKRRALTSPGHKHTVPLPTVAEAYADTFRRAGIPLESRFTTLYPDALPPLPEGIAPRGKGERWVAIAPFARHAGKIYPPELMRKVVADLADGYNADNGDANGNGESRRLFIFGFGDEESAMIESWREGRGNIINMAALRLGIEPELRLLAHCDLMLSMDSANMHLAGLVGIPVVAIWGATHPYTGFAGRTADPADAIQMQMVCRPCSIYGNKPCRRGDMHCLRGITPGRVTNAVNNKLKSIYR